MTAPAAPRLAWASATLPKANTAASENEDAVAAGPGVGRFAVADGASEGWQSGPWARHLAGAYVKRPPTPDGFPEWLAALRGDWKPPAATGPASWYSEAKSEQGSFATLLGVQFVPGKDGGYVWKAVAVGDSCLFVVRGGRIAAAFPVESAAGFGNRPRLVPSSPATECPEPDWLAGRAEPGDLFLMATDAAAAGIFHRADSALWASIRAALGRPKPSARTAGLLESLRDFRSLQNDDVSLLVVPSPVAPEPSP